MTDQNQEHIAGKDAGWNFPHDDDRCQQASVDAEGFISVCNALAERFPDLESGSATEAVHAVADRLTAQYERRARVEEFLDRVLGTEEADGSGEGLLGDVMLAVRVAFDAGVEAGATWQQSGPSGVPSDPPRDPWTSVTPPGAPAGGEEK